MPDNLADAEFRKIYQRIETKISLAGCETIDDVIKRLAEHPNFDNRIVTLMTKIGVESGMGFPERWLDMGLTQNWRTEFWKNYPDALVRVHRYPKGAEIGGKKVGGRFMPLPYIIFRKDQIEALRKGGWIQW